MSQPSLNALLALLALSGEPVGRGERLRRAATAWCATMNYAGKRGDFHYGERELTPNSEPSVSGVQYALRTHGGEPFWRLLHDLRVALRPLAAARSKNLRPALAETVESRVNAACSRFDHDVWTLWRTGSHGKREAIARDRERLIRLLRTSLDDGLYELLRGSRARSRVLNACRYRECASCARPFLRSRLGGSEGKHDFCSRAHAVTWWNAEIARRKRLAQQPHERR